MTPTTLTPKGEPLLAGRRGADAAILIVRDPRAVAPLAFANHNGSSIDKAIAFMGRPQFVSRERNASIELHLAARLAT